MTEWTLKVPLVAKVQLRMFTEGVTDARVAITRVLLGASSGSTHTRTLSGSSHGRPLELTCVIGFLEDVVGLDGMPRP